MARQTHRRIVLASIPGKRVEASDFSLERSGNRPDLKPGEVRVEPKMFGLNAGLRTRLGTGASTTLAPAIDIGDTPQSDAVGIVGESLADAMPTGSVVTGILPWSDSAVCDASNLRVLAPDADYVRHLTLLGHVGLTAYAALVTVGGLKAGETVWIPAAVGGVGSCAVQFAKALGARVIASASRGDRLDHLHDRLAIEHVMDRTQDLDAQLSAKAPDGLDMYLDLVGGNHLVTALAHMRERGRIIVAGMVGSHGGQPPILTDSSLLIRRRISLLGYSVTDHPQARAGLESLVTQTDAGRGMIPLASVHEGLASLPEAFANLLAGGNLGRGIVDVSVDE